MAWRNSVRGGERVTETSGATWPNGRALVERLVAETGDSLRAVLLYGSRLHNANPDRHSAFDFVVIVKDYQAFYTRLSAAGHLNRPVWLMTGLAGVLAPNVIAYAPEGTEGYLAKCLLVSESDFADALGPNPPDHFVLGRMLQMVGYVWAADPDAREWVESQIDGAHRRVLDWMAPYLASPLDVEKLGQRLLQVCYGGEFRPESQGRAARLFEAQAEHFARVLTPALDDAVASGSMTREGSHYSFTSPIPANIRRKWTWYFRRSKARTTIRWFKHAMTFANWLPYLVRKVERHTGRPVKLTRLERTFPVFCLWPRVIYVLLTRPPREIES